MKIRYLSFVPLLLAVVPASSYGQNIVTDAEPVDFVRACDAYGKGYFFVPGTQTCMRISGYVRIVASVGEQVYAKKKGDIANKSYSIPTRSGLYFSTASNTELGPLRSFVEIRSEWVNGRNSEAGILRYGFIELGGLRIGVDDSIFNRWTGYFGNIYHDNFNNQTAYARTNAVSYSYAGNNGFSAIIGAEQGTNQYTDSGIGYRINNNGLKAYILDSKIKNYTPNLLGGIKYEQDWGGLFAVIGYEAYYKDWAGKVRINLNTTDKLSLWFMAGYKSSDDHYGIDNSYQPRIIDGQSITSIYRLNERLYGDWGGKWSVWGGGAYQINAKTSFNLQLNYDGAKTFAASVNLRVEIVPGLLINPEINYISWENDYHSQNYKVSMKGEDAIRGMLRIQRSF